MSILCTCLFASVFIPNLVFSYVKIKHSGSIITNRQVLTSSWSPGKSPLFTFNLSYSFSHFITSLTPLTFAPKRLYEAHSPKQEFYDLSLASFYYKSVCKYDVTDSCKISWTTVDSVFSMSAEAFQIKDKKMNFSEDDATIMLFLSFSFNWFNNSNFTRSSICVIYLLI
jgi:hypothetical protein